ncbi:putative ABC transporter permease [Slackia heliotrinireducens]|uniref:putative ABC transporter permease n=1 Tax=Slackia heliotrinireducens TaxID=84110 RepID=UPI003315730A
MWVSNYIIWFFVCSMFGWLFETVYGTIVERQWENRGFLYGPACPIYGVGALAVVFTYQVAMHFGISMTWWQVFLVTFFGSAVLEYGTSWTLEKLFHALWWDYSNMPLNINGRICLPASTLFGFAGVAVVYGVYPAMLKLIMATPSEVLQLLAFLVTVVMTADATLTISALTRFAQVTAATEERINEHMTGFVQDIQLKAMELGDAAAAERERLKTLGPDQLIEFVQSKGAEFLAAFQEERRLYSMQLLSERFADLPASARSALRRVQGIRPAVPGLSAQRVNELWEAAKQRLPQKRR